MAPFSRLLAGNKSSFVGCKSCFTEKIKGFAAFKNSFNLTVPDCFYPHFKYDQQMRKLLTLALSLVVITTQLFAQTRMVTGKVTDAQGVALPNASVTIKGTTTGTTTNADGIFSLNVPSSAVLVIVHRSVLTSRKRSFADRD